MRMHVFAVAAAATLLATPVLAQTALDRSAVPGQAAAVPGTPGEAAISRNGAGPDSAITGTSESGHGGTGGSGGVLSNGTSDNAGTITGGPSGGNPTTGGSGS